MLYEVITESPLVKFELVLVIGGTFVALDIFFNHLFGDIPCAPRTVTDAPQMFSPVARITSYNVCYTKLLRPDALLSGFRYAGAASSGHRGGLVFPAEKPFRAP